MSAPSSAPLPTTLEALQAGFARICGDTPTPLFPQVMKDVVAMFAGEYLDYQKIDTPYHDLAHTLAVARCFLDIAEGRRLAGATPRWSARETDLGLVAALLHDTGYLKLRSDLKGTGAKYTFTHVLRSCAVASAHLPPLGVSMDELDDVLGAIRCTNTALDASKLKFRSEGARTVGLAVATADYLGQMAAPDYVDALPKLFAEFEESDDYVGVAREKRQFARAEELIAHTPDFWRQSVRPKLEHELEGQFRYLARPYPDGPNPAIAAVEAHVARIEALNKL